MAAERLQQLQTSLGRIDALIRAAVTRAQAAGHDPTDALRGMIISDDEVSTHLAASPLSGLWGDDGALPPLPIIEPDAGDTTFFTFASTFDLSLLDCYILLISLAPELDRRYERLYAYLQDDVSQRRPTVNLVMNLLGDDVPGRFAVWERLAPALPLRAYHLVECLPDPTRNGASFLASHVKVDPRVVAHLLGSQAMDERLQNAVALETPWSETISAGITPVRDALPYAPLILVRAERASDYRGEFAAMCAEFGLPLLVVDAQRLNALDIPAETAWRLTLREGMLRGAAVWVDGWQSALDEREQLPAALWTMLVEYPHPLFLAGSSDWEPLDTQRQRRVLRLQLTIPRYEERLAAWRTNAALFEADIEPRHLDALANKFRFTGAQIARAVQTAADIAASRGRELTVDDLYGGAQAHAGLRLGQFASRVTPEATWESLILPPDRLEQLREISLRARHTHQVRDVWGFHRVAKGRGISVLFAGESGTGKTLSAEVLARDLGLVMYKIDLSAVVSKYIGETEKNLSAIFDEAQSSNAILFFDEADALFGKRSEVKDARDRYANIEVAYLLQRIENYDGVAILATNFRQNLDEAFTRRLDFLIDFPFPESEYRQRIWEVHFPPEAPLGKDIDLAAVAEQYRLAGGNIRNAALASAYLAAAEGGVITQAHLRSAIRREHQKMGRLLAEERG